MAVLLFAMAVSQPVPVAADPDSFDFDIPAQPLDRALVAYGEVTGLQVFYDGSLAIGRRSSNVHGRMSAVRGLEVLLRGTGFVPQQTAYPDTVTIAAVPAPPPETPASAAGVLTPYFARIQLRIAESLCAVDTQAPGESHILLRIWIDGRGIVSRAEVTGATHRQAIARRLTGLSVGIVPPRSLPQPVTAVIFPPRPGEATGCPRPSPAAR
jgi:hypothetical protein